MSLDRESETRDAKALPGLALYGYPQCPFCRRVLDAIDALDLEIPLRNTMQDSGYQRELIEAMGRGTVPVLRIENASGEVEWLPESADIVRYLQDRFGVETANDGADGAPRHEEGFLERVAKLFHSEPRRN